MAGLDLKYEPASRLVVSAPLDAVAISIEPKGITVFEKLATEKSMYLRDTSGSTIHVAMVATSLVSVVERPLLNNLRTTMCGKRTLAIRSNETSTH